MLGQQSMADRDARDWSIAAVAEARWLLRHVFPRCRVITNAEAEQGTAPATASNEEGSMRMMDSRTRREHKITCIACATTMHPEMVPWLQHAIGCPVRTAELRAYGGPEITTSRSGQLADISGRAPA